MKHEEGSPLAFGVMEEDGAFSLNLRRALALKGIRAAQLARELDVSSSAVNQWLHNRTVPSARRLEEIAAVVGVQAGDLMGDSSGGTNVQTAQSDAAMIRIPVFSMQLQITPDDAGHGVPSLDRSKIKGESWVIPKKIAFLNASDDPDLCIVRVHGMSMSPEFHSGDYALVDLNWNEISSQGTYLIAQIAWAVMKRCDIVGGQVRMTSTEEGSSETMADIEEVGVVGRVIANMLVPR